jgi:hypothetical protein
MQHQLKNIKKFDKDYFEYAKGFLKLIVIVQIQLSPPPRSKNKTKGKRKSTSFNDYIIKMKPIRIPK